MQKKGLLALLLVAMMALSGCALIKVDEDVDNARIIIDVNGETVNKQVVNAMVDYQIAQNDYYNQMYATYFGMDAGLSTDPATLQPQVIDSYVETIVAQQKIKELGLDQLTEEETAQVNENAEAEYAAFLEQVAMYYLTGEELEGDALTARAEEYALENGLGSREEYVQTAQGDVQFAKLEAYAVKDVTVSDAEVQSALDEKVAADKTAYAENPDAYVNAVNSNLDVYYTPAGLRQVQQILVKFTEADSQIILEKASVQSGAQTALTTAQDNLDAAGEDADLDALTAAVQEAQAALDQADADVAAAQAAAAANIQQKADEIYALATAEGADFEALIAEYNEDTAAPAAGYVVGADVTIYVAPFTEGAMALENVGDVSQPVLTDYGYHILQYAGDLEEGPATMENAGESLKAELLTAKQEEVYEAALNEWVAQADVKTYPERLN